MSTVIDHTPGAALPPKGTVWGKADEVRDRLRAHLPAKDRKVTVEAFTTEWIAATLAASDRKTTTKAIRDGCQEAHRGRHDRDDVAGPTEAVAPRSMEETTPYRRTGRRRSLVGR